jgi:hypothetical protein
VLTTRALSHRRTKGLQCLINKQNVVFIVFSTIPISKIQKSLGDVKSQSQLELRASPTDHSSLSISLDRLFFILFSLFIFQRTSTGSLSSVLDREFFIVSLEVEI